MDKIPLDMRVLRSVCLADESTLIPEGSNYFYQDNNSPILAIAHCDYVSHGKIDFASFKYKGSHTILCETLDDRLGVYIITKLLPSMGVITDILLTTDEEIGKSTARDFKTDKQYNWMFSFDRRGTSIVCYKYRDKELEDVLLKSTGRTFDYGSNSDITYLDHLGVKGINFGAGYQYEHTEGCLAQVRDITSGVSTFMAFYNANKDVRLVHTPPPPPVYRGNTNRRSYLEGDDAGYDYGDDGYWRGGKLEFPFGKDAPKEKQLALPAPKKKKKNRYSWTYCDFCTQTNVTTRWDEVLVGRICKDCESILLREPGGVPPIHCISCGLPDNGEVLIQRLTMPTVDSNGKATGRKRAFHICDECLAILSSEELSTYAIEPKPILTIPFTGEDYVKTKHEST